MTTAGPRGSVRARACATMQRALGGVVHRTERRRENRGHVTLISAPQAVGTGGHTRPETRAKTPRSRRRRGGASEHFRLPQDECGCSPSEQDPGRKHAPRLPDTVCSTFMHGLGVPRCAVPGHPLAHVPSRAWGILLCSRAQKP